MNRPLRKPIGIVAAMLAILLSACLPAAADEASRMAKVEEYVRLSKLEQSYAQTMTLMMNQVWATISRQLQTAILPSIPLDEMAPLKERLNLVLQESIGWERMKVEYMQLYAEAFTDEELDGIVAFYRSPAGQRVVAQTPELMNKSVAIAQRRMMESQPAIQAVIEEFLKSRNAPREEPATPAPPAP